MMGAMPRTVDYGLRTKLEERGLWVAFREWRRDLKQRLGMAPADAREVANRVFRRVLAGEVAPDALRDAAGRPVVPTDAAPSQAAPPAPVPVAESASGDPLEALRRKKSARFAVEFRWVIQHRRDENPDPATCPDIEAWNILQDCRDDVSLYKSLLVEFGRRGLARDDGDERHPDEVDGQAEVDALDALLGRPDEDEAEGEP